MLLRKLSEITNNKPTFSQYNIFYNYKFFFFQSTFWSIFNHRQKSQSSGEQCSLCCTSPCFSVFLYTHYGSVQCFSTYFRKKKLKFYSPYFQTMLFLVTMMSVNIPWVCRSGAGGGGGGGGGFYKFFKNNFVAQETIGPNILWPSNFFRKYFINPPINFTFLFKD